MGIKKRAFAVVLSAIMLLSVAGVGTASAVTKNVGGGKWTYDIIYYQSGLKVVSSRYYHKTRQHGASAKIGKSGKVYRRCASAGNWTSNAIAKGFGTAYTYWHNTCNH